MVTAGGAGALWSNRELFKWFRVLVLQDEKNMETGGTTL
jgi:hypothetical protein